MRRAHLLFKPVFDSIFSLICQLSTKPASENRKPILVNPCYEHWPKTQLQNIIKAEWILSVSQYLCDTFNKCVELLYRHHRRNVVKLLCDPCSQDIFIWAIFPISSEPWPFFLSSSVAFIFLFLLQRLPVFHFLIIRLGRLTPKESEAWQHRNTPFFVL